MANDPRSRTGHNAPLSRLTIVGGVLGITFIGLAAVLFVSPGGEATQRLGLLFALLGTAMAALVGALRSDQAASGLNGGLDARIQAAVFQAQAVRRATDPDGRGVTDPGMAIADQAQAMRGESDAP
jgi:hypothetical protein